MRLRHIPLGGRHVEREHGHLQHVRYLQQGMMRQEMKSPLTSACIHNTTREEILDC